MKITYSRHTPDKSTLYSTLVYGNTVPFRITALWWISILFTTSDKFTTICENSPQQNSPHFQKEFTKIKKILFCLSCMTTPPYKTYQTPRKSEEAKHTNPPTHTTHQTHTLSSLLLSFSPSFSSPPFSSPSKQQTTNTYNIPNPHTSTFNNA